MIAHPSPTRERPYRLTDKQRLRNAETSIKVINAKLNLLIVIVVATGLLDVVAK